MDLLSFAVGVAVGAAFAPFWMMVWEKIKSFNLFTKKNEGDQ